MNYFKKILVITLGVVLLAGCNKFDEWNTNPNQTTTPDAAMLCGYMINHIAKQNGGYSKTYLDPYYRPKLVIWMEGQSGAQYNSIGAMDTPDINILHNLDKMVEAAEEKFDENTANSYKGVRHFIRVYKFLDNTLRVGDIPYSDAIKWYTDVIFYPKYDTQKDVFLGLLEELDLADQYFADGAQFSGDIVYGGDPAKWRKLVNSYQLEVLSHLYKKTGDTDINLSQRYASLISRPLMESNADNFQLTFSNVANQRYPMNNTEVGNQYDDYFMHSSIVIDYLKQFRDRRLFCYAEPTPYDVKFNGADGSLFESYAGGDPGAPYTQLEDLYNAEKDERQYSTYNNRYFKDVVCEPIYVFSYTDSQFLLAEAKARGFFTGGNTAQQYYEEGIRSNMLFTRDGTKDEFNHGMPITDDWITQYLAYPEVAFTSTLEDQIEQIGIQRYLSLFLRGVNHAYWSWRRLGIPDIPINTETNLYTPNNEYPMRWTYSGNEKTYNTDNVQEAIDRQFGTSDNNSGLMWIFKD